MPRSDESRDPQRPRSSSPPAKPRRDWRLKSPQSGDVVPSASGEARLLDRDAKMPGYQRLYALGSLGGLAVLLLGVLIYYYWNTNRGAYLLSVSVTDNGRWLPPNAYAAEDQDAFAFFKDERGSDLRHRPVMLSERDDSPLTDSILKALNPTGPSAVLAGGPDGDRGVLLLHLSAHGVVDENGVPYLIGPGPTKSLLRTESLASQRNLLKVRDFLKALEDHVAARYPNAKLLVFLDTARLDIQWQAGVLHSTFVARVQELLQKDQFAHLIVLSSASPGEIAWSAPELGAKGQTAFGYFLIRGLAGEAATEARDSRTLTLSELQSYLSREVSRWVASHRGAPQHPLLLTPLTEREQGLRLVKCGSRAIAESEPDLAQLKKNADRLESVWKQHAKFAERYHNLAYHHHAAQWADFEHRLARLDQLWLSGSAYEKDLDSALERLEQDIAALGKQAPAETFKWTPSLPSARLVSDAKALPSDPSLVERRRQAWLADWELKHSGKQLSKEEAERVQESDSQIQRADYLEIAEFAWQVVQQASWKGTPQEKGALQKLVDQLGGSSAHPWAELDLLEVNYLKLLLRHLDEEDFPKLQPFVATSVRIREEAEQAWVPADIRALPPLVGLLREADRSRRLAEDQLFIGPAAAQKAMDTWQTLADTKFTDDAPARGKYDLAGQWQAELAQQYRVRDGILARTPGILEWLARRWQGNAWSQAADASTKTVSADLATSASVRDQAKLALKVWLAAPGLPTPMENLRLEGSWENQRKQLQEQIDERAAERKALQEDLRRLAAALRTRWNYVQDRIAEEGKTPSERQGETLREALELLALPFFEGRSGSDRAVLRSDLVKLLEKSAAAESASKGPSSEYKLEQEQSLLTELAQVTEMAKLGLAGADSAATLEQLAGRMRAFGREEQTKLQKALEVQQKRLRQDDTVQEVREALRGADLAARRVAWLDPSVDEADPALEWPRFELVQMMYEQRRRAIADFWGPVGPGKASYFDLASQANPVDSRHPWKCESQEKAIDQERRAAQDLVEAGVAMELPEQLLISKQATDLEIDVVYKPTSRFKELGGRPLSLLPGRVAIYLDARSPDGESKRKPVPIQEGGASSNRWGREWEKEVSAWPTDHVVFSAAGLQDYRYLASTALFRGHVWDQWRQARLVQPGAPLLVEVKRVFEPTTITVHGDDKRTLDLVFVLDCSFSMTTKEEVPREGGGVEILPRFEIATRALRNAVRDLANRAAKGQIPACRAQLIAYGHQTSNGALPGFVAKQYRRSKGGKLEEFFVKPEARTINGIVSLPSDVGIVMQRMDIDRFAQNLDDALNGLHPAGITPLYYAMREAIAQSESRHDKNTSSHVVVLTDGADEQDRLWSVLDEKGENEQSINPKVFVDLDDVGLNRTKVDVQVLGLFLDKSKIPAHLKDAQRIREWRDKVEALQKALGARYQPATSVREIATLIGKSIKASDVAVTRLADNKKEGPTVLGKEISLWPGLNNRFLPTKMRVDVSEFSGATKELSLYGGERVHLQLVEGGLKFRRLTGPEKWVTITRDVQCAMVDKAAKNGEGIRFQVAFQDPALESLPARPALVWAEIKPNGPGAVSYCYDQDFGEGNSTPTLTLRTPTWNFGAGSGSVDLYLLPAGQPLSESTGLNKTISFRTIDSGTKFKFDDADFEIRQSDEEAFFRIEIVESRSMGAEAASAPTLIDVVPAADEVEHAYERDSNRNLTGKVVHSYRFRTGRSLKESESAKIQLISAREFKLQPQVRKVDKLEFQVVPTGK